MADPACDADETATYSRPSLLILFLTNVIFDIREAVADLEDKADENGQGRRATTFARHFAANARRDSLMLAF